MAGKLKRLSMKITMVFCLPVLISCMLAIKERPTKNEYIKVLKVSRRSPDFNIATGKITGYDIDEIELYFWKEKVLYREPYDYYWMNIDGNIDSIQKRISYMVTSKGNRHGLFFEMNNYFSGQRMQMDSFFKSKWYYYRPTDSLIKNCDVKLTRTIFNEDSGILNNTYFVRKKSDTSITSTMTLTYGNSKEQAEIDYYSIAKDFDTIKGMKINRIFISNDLHYFKDYNYTLDSFDMDWKLELIQIDSLPADVALYFKKADELDKQRALK